MLNKQTKQLQALEMFNKSQIQKYRQIQIPMSNQNQQ